MHDGRANDGRVGDDDRLLVMCVLAAEPFGDPLHEAEDRLSAVRRRRRIAQPCGDGSRITGIHVVEAASGPKPVVAIAQRRQCDRFDSERFGCLRVRSSGLIQYRSASGKCPASAAARVLPMSSIGSFDGKATLRTASVDA